MSDPTPRFERPAEVDEALAKFGARLRLARLRRGWSLGDLAMRAGINRNTLTALEQGRPGSAVGNCLTVLWALGLEASFDALADPDADAHGLRLEQARRARRGRSLRGGGDGYDF